MVKEKPNENKKRKQQQKEQQQQQQQWPTKTLCTSYLSVSDTIMDDAEHFKTGSL